MSGVLSFFLRTLLGSEGVMQRLHFLVGFLKQRVDQFNACRERNKKGGLQSRVVSL